MSTSLLNHISTVQLTVMVSHFVLITASLATAALGQTGTQCSHPTMFYDQRVNHSDPDSGTFKQQYQLVLDYYKPGGPILFYQGAETTNLSCVVRIRVTAIRYMRC